jgi:SET domain-containing protein
MIVDETDDRFYAAPSTLPGAGQGLFARVPLRAGERLTLVGVLVRRESAADRYTSFADAYKVRAGENLLIPFGVGGMANHSVHPNVEKVVDGETVYLQLLRDVGAGEELCFAYSDYARERFGIA